MGDPTSARLHLYVTPDGTEWVIAASQDDAWAAREEHTGEKRDDFRKDWWREVAPTDKLSISVDAAGDPTDPNTSRAIITLTAERWIERRGRGWLCTNRALKPMPRRALLDQYPPAINAVRTHPEPTPARRRRRGERDTSVHDAATDQMVNAIQALAIALRQHTALPGPLSRQPRVREELETAQRAVERALVYTKG